MQPVPEQFTKARETHGEERRLRIRRSPAALTYVTLGENNGGILANVSETGMSVTAGEPLRENVFSRVSFTLPPSDRLIESRAEVVWTSESKKEAGLRFVDMREDTREQIRNWISPPRRNGRKVEPPTESTSNRESESRLTAAATTENPSSGRPAEKSKGHAADVESSYEPKEAAPAAPPTESFATQDKATTGPMESSRLSEAVLLQRLAANGSGPKSWAFTAAQRAEFERLFPSEIRGGDSRETAAPEIAAQSESVVGSVPAAAPGFVSPIADSAPQHVAAPAHEHRAERSPSDQRAADVAPEVADPARMWRAAPAIASPRMPAQSLWDAPPPMLRPIIGGGFGSSYGAQPVDSAEESRPRSFWSIAALSILIVAACFALGFAEGPDLVRNWPMMEDVRQIVRDKLNHVKTSVTNRDNAKPTASLNAPAVTPNTATNELAATPAPPVLPAPATPAPTAPDTTAPPAGNTAPDANAAPNVAGPGNTPSGDSTPSNSASSGKSGEVNATAPPAITDSAPAPAAKERRSEPSVSAPRTPESRASASPTPRKETPVDTPYTPPVMKTAPTAGVNTPREVSPPAAPSTHAAESSTPLGSSSVPSSSTPNSSAPNSSPAKTPSAPPVSAAAPAAHPATSPPSYFPVVAPAAGNVPRLIELPEEKVIDTAAVVIHSHQIVFVPAEPGPESSHRLEKLRIGDRTTKLAPTYPPQAAQKGMGGTVHLRAIIGKDGNVQDVRPINGPIMLIPAAVEAIRQWQYRPTLLDQQPIEMQEDFTIEFRPLGVQAKE